MRDWTDFIAHEQSLALKELGFEGHCFGHYLKNGFSQSEAYKQSDEITLRPTYSQAFRFFREKYGLYQIIIQNTDNDWTYDVITIKGIGDFEILDVFHSYEEAELACLKKLIQIVKEQ